MTRRAVFAGFVLIAQFAAAMPAGAAGKVTGSITVDGKSIAVATGRAFEQTSSADDPVTWVRLTEKPGSSELKADTEAAMGQLGAFAGFHIHKSGKVEQAIAVHPGADPNFATSLPAASIRVTGLRVEGGEIAGTVESAGELRVEGHVWQLRFEFRLPIERH